MSEPPGPTSSPPALGIGVIGAGFMGRAHLAAYRAAAEAGFAHRIVAVSGRGLSDPERADPGAHPGGARGNLALETDTAALGLEGAVLTSEADEVLAHPDIDAVSLCTPTDTHVDLARRALEAGKHVLVEKPVALASSEVEELLRAARDHGRLCMPAMCMRFWPGWDWLHARIVQGDLGPVRSAVFRRLGSPPDWSRDFYGDPRRSGGALFDLHVHDADFVRFCFGDPDSVLSRGTLDHVATLYTFEGGPDLVLAEGGWDHAPGFAFRMEYTVVFEHGTADYALGRDPLLSLTRDGRTQPVALGGGTGYDGEVRRFLTAVSEGATSVEPSLEDALAVTRLLEAEARSLEA